ncbi:PRC-barrel domain containing protein [Halorarius litoreus]|uniref:PRC-barrel domain containing protein n=1 Tax=Halorarius litoreus TaxID=2962676 RepID=UPI0020CBDBFF|nr:PRC-barrel domain containing protein [Halorarius litoreus]
MSQTLTEKDEGKRVVDENGNKVGMITTVRDGTGYVDPDPSIADKVLSRFGWGDIDEDTYPLESSNVDHITDDEVRLKR